MSAWIKMNKDLVDSPKIIKLAHLLKIDTQKAIGAVFEFWVWMDSITADGKGVELSDNYIDGKIKIPNFSEKMREIGWISGKEWAIKLPNFEENNGVSEKRRSLTAKRVAKHKKKTSNASCVTKVTER